MHDCQKDFVSLAERFYKAIRKVFTALQEDFIRLLERFL